MNIDYTSLTWHQRQAIYRPITFDGWHAVQSPTGKVSARFTAPEYAIRECDRLNDLYALTPPSIATPVPGTVTDVRDNPCTQAVADSYPLYARCVNCDRMIVCRDATASWAHIAPTNRGPACHGDSERGAR